MFLFGIFFPSYGSRSEAWALEYGHGSKPCGTLHPKRLSWKTADEPLDPQRSIYCQAGLGGAIPNPAAPAPKRLKHVRRGEGVKPLASCFDYALTSLFSCSISTQCFCCVAVVEFKTFSGVKLLLLIDCDISNHFSSVAGSRFLVAAFAGYWRSRMIFFSPGPSQTMWWVKIPLNLTESLLKGRLPQGGVPESLFNQLDRAAEPSWGAGQEGALRSQVAGQQQLQGSVCLHRQGGSVGLGKWSKRCRCVGHKSRKDWEDRKVEVD